MVRAGFASLNEVYSEWSMLDLLEANIVISAFEEAEAEAHQ